MSSSRHKSKPTASWDPRVDAAYFQFSWQTPYLAREVKPGVLLHVDRKGKVVGLEVLDFSRRMETFPQDIEVGIRRRVRVAKLGWYDKEVDAASFCLSRSKYVESEEVSPGIILDFDRKERVIGVEILSFSERFAADSPARSLLKRAKPLSHGRMRILRVGPVAAKPSP